MAAELHVNDVGTEFIATIKENNVAVDVSIATVKKMVFKKPSGRLLVKDAAFVTDGTNGKIKYVSEAGFLNEIGDWSVQGRVTLSTWSGHSDVHEFEVHQILRQTT